MKRVFHLLLLLFFNCLLLTGIQAQDKTAAGVYNDGLALLKAKDYEQGLALMEESIALAEQEENEQVISLAKKNGSVAASNVGNSAYKAGEFDKAMEFYMKGLELNSENVSCLLGKARVLDKQDMKAEAVSTFIEAGDLYVASEKADRAEKVYKQAQTIVGKLYVGKNYDEAIEAGMAHLDKRENAEVYYYMSRCQLEKKNNEDALQYISKAIELATAGESVDDKYYMALGISLENLGRTNEAVEAYKKITGDKYRSNAEYRVKSIQG